MSLFELLLVIFCVILLGVVGYLLLLVSKLQKERDSIHFSKASQSVKYGQLTEQWIPFSSKFPYNAQNFRFIGKPIDGISFEEDSIVFVEFKSNKSQLSESQKKVRELVEKKKVEWFELRAE